MAFDIKKFENSSFQERLKTIQVPTMLAFFPKEESPSFTIKGLTGAEIGKANEAQETCKNMDGLLNAIVASSGKEKAEGIKALLGVNSDDVPGDVVRRQELLFLGLVEPKLDRSQVVKLSEAFPVVFYNLTNEILKLSGQGKTLGKQKASGKVTT